MTVNKFVLSLTYQFLIRAVESGQVHQPIGRLVTLGNGGNTMGDQRHGIHKYRTGHEQVGSRNQGPTGQINQLQNELALKRDEKKLPQIRAYDRLALIQKIVQTHELYETPNASILYHPPGDGSSWNPLDLLSRFSLTGKQLKATSTGYETLYYQNPVLPC